MYAHRKMIVTIAGALVVCAGLHLLVFAPLNAQWNALHREIEQNLAQFREKTGDLPLDIENIDEVRAITRRYQNVIEQQYATLLEIEKELPIFAPPAETSLEVMIDTILEWLRKIADVEASTKTTRIGILQNLGIGVDQVDGLDATKAYYASSKGIRSYLVNRPTEPARPRIRGESGTIEFFFKPSWSGATNREPRILFYARSQPAPNTDPRVRNEPQVDNYILLSVAGSTLFATLKTAGYNPKTIEASIDTWKADEWRHVAFAYNMGAMRIFLDGQPIDQSARKRSVTSPPLPGTKFTPATTASRAVAAEPPIDEMPAGGGVDRAALIEMMRRGALPGGPAPPPPVAPAAPGARAAAGDPPPQFRVHDLVEIHLGGYPEYVGFAEGAFENLRIRNTDAFAFTPKYDGSAHDTLFFEDFNDEMVEIADLPDALQAAHSMLLIYHDTNNIVKQVRDQTWDSLQIVRSMLGGVSERQTQVANEFYSFPKHLFAADQVARHVGLNAMQVLEKLNSTIPQPGIIRELYLYLVVGRDLALHAAASKADSVPVYRYMGGSRDLNDDELIKWIGRRINMLNPRSNEYIPEEVRQQRAKEYNLPLDVRDAQAEIKKLQEAQKGEVPPHWVRTAYETSGEGEDKRAKDYRRIMLNISVEGTLVAITKFLYSLEQQTHLVTVEELQVKDIPAKPGKLMATLRCEAHFIEQPKPEERPADLPADERIGPATGATALNL